MTKPCPILVAEDEETDIFILRRALRKAGLVNPLVAVKDGQQAIDYLEGRPPYHDRAEHPLPALVLLDLKMPRMTGFEVLSWLAERSEFGAIPAIVLSSSSYEEDMAKARQLGARDYHIKPHSINDLVSLVRAISERWLSGGGQSGNSQLK